MGIIYKATNQIDGKVYVGMTNLSLGERVRRHRHSSQSKSPSLKFQAILKEEGFSNFKWSVLETVEKGSLAEREIFWISSLKSNDPTLGYNRTVGGFGANKGNKDSPETRHKKSLGMMGNKNSSGPRPPMSKSHREAISRAMSKPKAHPMSESHRRAISETMKGRQKSLEHRKKISEGVKSFMVQSNQPIPPFNKPTTNL